MRLLPLLALLLPLPALAQAPQTTVRYEHILAGTGFVVNGQGDVITNAHVVNNCQSIHLGTADGKRTPAQVVFSDAGKDLALLRANAAPTPGIAILRSNIRDLAVGDTATVIGFPGKTNLTGRYRLRNGHVTNLTGPEGEAGLLQLSPTVEQGDSGGPVLDAAGNVIGVTAAYALIFQEDKTHQTPPKLVGRTSVAITLPVLREFLDAHTIPFQESASGLVAQSTAATESTAREFIIPVRCVQGTQ